LDREAVGAGEILAERTGGRSIKRTRSEQCKTKDAAVVGQATGRLVTRLALGKK